MPAVPLPLPIYSSDYTLCDVICRSGNDIRRFCKQLRESADRAEIAHPAAPQWLSIEICS